MAALAIRSAHLAIGVSAAQYHGTRMEPTDASSEWLADFEAASRRPLALRMRYAFIHTYKPVLDDASYRAFDTIGEYRDWCERNVPSWLGYGRV